MDKTIDKNTERFYELLKLLNNCREKIYGLYNLYVSSVNSAREKSEYLSNLYDELLSFCSEVYNEKFSKGAIKSIVSKTGSLKSEFSDGRNEFSNALVGLGDLRKDYQKDVNSCCVVYKKMDKGNVSQEIESGYRKQVNMIREILNGIAKVKEKYFKLNDFVQDLSTRFYEKFDDLTSYLNNQCIIKSN